VTEEDKEDKKVNLPRKENWHTLFVLCDRRIRKIEDRDIVNDR